MKSCASAALKSMCLQQNYTLKKSIKSAGAEEGRQHCQATVKGGSCYSEAARGGSRRRLIRKYRPTSTVAPATPAARRMKIKLKSSPLQSLGHLGVVQDDSHKSGVAS